MIKTRWEICFNATFLYIFFLILVHQLAQNFKTAYLTKVLLFEFSHEGVYNEWSYSVRSLLLYYDNNLKDKETLFLKIKFYCCIKIFRKFLSERSCLLYNWNRKKDKPCTTLRLEKKKKKLLKMMIIVK